MSELHRAFDALEPAMLRARANAKWNVEDPDVLPLWVADMDLPIASGIRTAIQAYADGENFGYPPHEGLPGVTEACAGRLERRFGWRVDPAAVVLLPGIIPAMYASVETFTDPGDEALLTTPLYPWFQKAVEGSGRTPVAVDMEPDPTGRYRLSAEALGRRVTDATRMLMLCHPHNPTGRAFDVGELEAVAELALEHDLWVVSDELHADLTLAGTHVPFASLGPEIAARTVTLYGPTKAFNIAGMKVGFAIVEDEAARERLNATCLGRVPEPNVLAQVAARAAFTECDAWLEDTRSYLRANRDLVADTVRERMPGVRHVPPEATYLAWLDFRDTPIAQAPAAWLHEHARVKLNEGSDFGAAGAGFARLNLATSRGIVHSALDRMARALEEAGSAR